MCEQDKEEDTEAEEKFKKADVVCKQDGIIKESENKEVIESDSPACEEEVPDEEKVDTLMINDSRSSEEKWLQVDANSLSQRERRELCNESRLDDLHISYAQALLKKQFPG